MHIIYILDEQRMNVFSKRDHGKDKLRTLRRIFYLPCNFIVLKMSISQVNSQILLQGGFLIKEDQISS